MISCLSEIIAKDTIQDQKHSLPKPCREQVRAQLYQQRENIDLNPKLKTTCNKDIKKYCVDVEAGSGKVSTPGDFDPCNFLKFVVTGFRMFDGESGSIEQQLQARVVRDQEVRAHGQSNGFRADERLQGNA